MHCFPSNVLMAHQDAISAQITIIAALLGLKITIKQIIVIVVNRNH